MDESLLSPIFCVTDRADLAGLLHTALQDWGPTRILKRDKGTTVALVSLPQGAVVTKHHSLQRWRRIGDAALHGSPARRSWQGANLLQEHGFPVPRPLAVLECRQSGFPGFIRESLYVSEGLIHQTPLNLYWRDHHQAWPLSQQRQFLGALADFLRAFHSAGLYAGDMKDANLFVEENKVQNQHNQPYWKFYLVDLDHVRHFPSLSMQRRLKNLVQLERTLGHSARASERLFFLYHYLGPPLPPRTRRRALLRQLIALRDKKDKEYTRRRVRNRRRPTHPTHLGLPFIESPDQHAPHSQLPARASISCCIVCFNEEANIRRCLESVKWCDEIVIVDSFSTDRTPHICQEYTPKVIQRAWPGYVEQKRFALSQASYEWVLNVDADEEVSPELQQDILSVLERNDPAVDGFYIPRLVYYLGRWWRRGWYPGYRLRLFRKTKVRWGGVNPHEKVLLRGQADRLPGNLYHYTYDDITDHLRAINGLTDIAAHELALRGKHVGVLDIVFRPFWRFLRFYLLSGCIRDGRAGFLSQSLQPFILSSNMPSCGNTTSSVNTTAGTPIRPAILHVDPERNWGGGEGQVFGLSSYLHQAGHRSVVAADPRGLLYHKLAAAQLPHCALPIRNDVDVPAGLRLRRVVRAGQYDLVHFHTARAHALSPWLAGLSCKRLVTRRMDYGLKNTRWNHWLYVKSVDAVVAISHRVETALLTAGIPRAHIHRIPSGVETARFVVPVQTRQQIRRQYGISDEDIVIISVGALVERKDHHTLLQAAHTLRQDGHGGHQPHVLICGEGPLQASLEAQAERLGIAHYTHFTGFCPDVPAHLAAADVFVHTPLWEGLGVAVIEALAAGLPVIASRVGGIPELIEDQHAGFLIPPQDVAALTQALERLLPAPGLRQTLGRAGQVRAQTYFDILTMARANEMLYDELLTGTIAKSTTP